MRLWPRKTEQAAPAPERRVVSMQEAEAAIAASRAAVEAAHRRTPMIRTVMAELAVLRAEDHFGQRITQAVRDEQGPAGNAHGH